METLQYIDGGRISLGGQSYEIEEIAFGSQLKVIWPTKATFTDLFAGLLNTNGQVVGIKALYDFLVSGTVRATGNVIAGTDTGQDEIGNVLYRLDTWDGYTDAQYGDWVPSAEIVNQSIKALQRAIEEGTSGGGAIVTVEMSSDGKSIILGVNGTPYVLPLTSTLNSAIQTVTASLANYLLVSTFNSIFEVTTAKVKVKNDGATIRDFEVPGKITAGGNVIAGSASTSEEIGNVLYRLDSWNDYDDTDQQDQQMVLSATLAFAMKTAIENLADIIDHFDPSAGGTTVSWGTVTSKYADLIVGDEPAKRLLLYAEYLEKATFDSIFSYNTSTLLTVLRNLAVNGQITATGNIIAGAASGTDALGEILYRMDNWSETSQTGWQQWALSAALGKDLLDRVIYLEEHPAESGSNVAWETEITGQSVELNVEDVVKTLAIAGHTHSQYMLQSAFDNLFAVTATMLTVLGGRGLTVPGAISSGDDITATGNVIAGVPSSGSEIGNVLYRLDSWGNYVPAPAADSTEDWVPSAKIVKDKLDELEAAIDDIEPGGESYDDTELRQQIFTLQQQNAALTTRVQTLEARKQFEFVLPGETWPPTTMEENMLYIKLNQVS